MSKPAYWTAAAFIAVLVIASGLNYLLKSSNPEIEISEAAKSFILKTDKALLPSERVVDCGQALQIRKGIPPEHFWQSDESAVPESFVFFDEKSRDLAGCHRGEPFAAQIMREVGGRRGDREVVSLKAAQIADLNSDRKPEFFVYHANCAGQDCSAEQWLLQVRANRIQILFTIAAEEVSRISGGAVVLRKDCLTEDYARGPGYIAVAELGEGEDLKMVPYPDIAKKYPAVLEAFAKGGDLDAKYGPIKSMYLLAYKGEDLKETLHTYEVYAAGFSSGLKLRCDPRENLKIISGQ